MDLDVWIDYHCPYCRRAVEWLEKLAPAVARPRFRLFALEQVNRDPSATDWRLWDQPLDYEHYRGRQERRPLASFLVTAHLETAAPSCLAPFRRLVYEARFDEGRDIASVEVVAELAGRAGASAAEAAAFLADPGRQVEARARIRDDWMAARDDYATFGVPTLRLDGRRPFYLRLAAVPSGEEARELWERLTVLDERAPYLVELKRPDPVPGKEGA